VTWKPFARVLVRKSQRALKVARLALNAGDSDSAVNRSYYAMLNVAQAALLSAGVAEDKLPRTHNGVSEAFRLHAVQSGLIDRQLASELRRLGVRRARIGCGCGKSRKPEMHQVGRTRWKRNDAKLAKIG
jgi:uncharacterized protein (UPF0332 family)